MSREPSAAGAEPKARRHPGVHVPPPLLFAGALGVGFLAQRRVPLDVLPDGARVVGVLGGWALIGGSLGVGGWAMLTFLRARTPIMPNRRAARLVTGGPYALSRNPMYVSLTCLYLGVSLLLDSLWPVLLLPAVLGVLYAWVIRSEERHLASAFGLEYEAYRARVRRWL